MSVELPSDAVILAGAALLASGVLGAAFAHRLRVPGLLLFLGIGMLIADDGLALVRFDNARLAQAGAAVALALILFEGGLTTKPSDVRRAAIPGLMLATVGVVMTAGLVAVGAVVLLRVDPTTGMLIGAVVASTDAAAIFALLRHVSLPRRLTALLEVESGANDPIAVVLTVGILATLEGDLGVAAWVGFTAAQLGGGLAFGLVIGAMGARILNRIQLGSAGLYPVFALAVGGLAYGVPANVGASGFLAVYVAGLVIGALVPRHRRSIRTFHEGLANTAEIGLFLLLGVLVFPSQLLSVALPAFAMTAVLVLVARPAAVAACLAWFGYSWRELAVVSWAGLRGAVPIVLATFPLSAGYPEGAVIFNVVFFVVLVSAAVQGLTVAPLAGWLGLQASGPAWAPVAEALPLEGVDADLIEVDVTADLAVAGRFLRQVPLPSGGLLTAIVRGRRVLVPTGASRLAAGDLLLVTMPKRETATSEVVAWARGETAASQADSPKGGGSAQRRV